MKTQHILTRWLSKTNQVELSARSGINRATINRHMHGKVPINDDHLVGYLKAAPSKKDAAEFAAAWMADTIPTDIVNQIITKEGKINAKGFPKLRPETEVAIQWLCAELNTDPELESGFLRFVHWVGGPSKNILTTLNDPSSRVAEEPATYEAKE